MGEITITVIEQASRYFPRERGFKGPFDSELHKLEEMRVLALPREGEHIHVRGSNFTVRSVQHVGAKMNSTALVPRAIVYVTYNGATRVPPTKEWVDTRTGVERNTARKDDQKEMMAR